MEEATGLVSVIVYQKIPLFGMKEGQFYLQTGTRMNPTITEREMKIVLEYG